jgi:hypothetical protein
LGKSTMEFYSMAGYLGRFLRTAGLPILDQFIAHAHAQRLHCAP